MADEIKVNLGIDGKAIQELAGEAILRAIDDGARERLIKEALQHLLTRPSSQYGSRESPLQGAFQSAVADVARKIVNEKLVGDPEIEAEVKKLVEEAWAKLRANHGETRDKLVDQIANLISKAIAPDRY